MRRNLLHPIRLPLFLLSLLIGQTQPAATPDHTPLRISVYATAGDLQQHLASPEARERTARLLEPLQVSRLWLEGRRGDEYVDPATLDAVRAFFQSRGVDSAGGIATVPGQNFGTRQNTDLDWFNWESPATQRDIAGFFTENAPVFPTLIVDDFYCTADTSPSSERARGNRPWGEYRRDLLVSLLEPMIFRPARAARPDVQLILKYPQWYDRFHLFGYDPRRMSPPFDLIWVGTEVRNPFTRRMGFVQPTEGYINFRWLTAVAGSKVRGAWFDHIECTAEQFVDQAYQSVLAGASELTLFRLGDIIDGHPGDPLLAQRIPDLMSLHRRLQGQTLRGVAFYKPSGSPSDDNTYLMDYLAMIGLPILPAADYPENADLAFLAVQAAADPDILSRMQRHLERGATLIVTPAFLRAVGAPAAEWAGIQIASTSEPRSASEIHDAGHKVTLDHALEIDGGVKSLQAHVLLDAKTNERSVPLLTSCDVGPGRLILFNIRTFSEQDFQDAGEWLLAPKPLGLSSIPETLANPIRKLLLEKLDLDLQGPAGVSFVLLQNGACLYNFHNQPAFVRLNGQSATVPGKGWTWLDLPMNTHE
jgi:hypothetical protein